MDQVCPRCGKELPSSQKIHLTCFLARVWQVFSLPIGAVIALLTLGLSAFLIPRLPVPTVEPTIIVIANMTSIVTNTPTQGDVVPLLTPTQTSELPLRNATPQETSEAIIILPTKTLVPTTTTITIQAQTAIAPLPSLTPVPTEETIRVLSPVTPTEAPIIVLAPTSIRNTSPTPHPVSTRRPTARPVSTRLPTATALTRLLCAGVETRFEIGDTVVIDFNGTGALRILRYYNSGPDQTLAQGYDNERMVLNEGPVCFNRQWYWSATIRKGNGRTYSGWVAETDVDGSPFLCPQNDPECR